MIREVDLPSYLPPFLQRFKELNSLLSTENKEFHIAWESVKPAFEDLNLFTATEDGITRREKMLGIQPKILEGIEERRFTILSKSIQKTPFTVKMLNEQLENLCGAGNYSVNIDSNLHIVSVTVGLVAKNSIEDIAALLEEIVPVNMQIILGIKYNRHSTIKAMTHKELSKYSHYQLRNEVFE